MSNQQHTPRLVLEKRKNKKGVIYALVATGSVFEVWKLCENYSRHIKGGIEKTWRYVEKNMSRESAETLFNRRSA